MTAAVCVLGTPAFAATGMLQVFAANEISKDECGVSPNKPCHPNNGFGNGGGDGVPGNSGGKPGSTKCGPGNDTKC